jgi:hypothetical protein
VKWFTVRHGNDAVGVAAQKKGIAIRRRDIELLKARLERAEAHDKENDVKEGRT